MCGFSGFIDYHHHSDEEVLKSMTNAIEYRGPDDSGFLLSQEKKCTIGLGHRRLSILDLSPLGHQPMVFNHLSIIYNGEIYNFNEIREVLINDHLRHFVSHSDTEVILQAYDVWGIDCIHQFNGMFAFAMLDQKKQKLTLVRDRAGVKPLYFHTSSGLVLFASELKSFHKHPRFDKKINNDALALYLQYGYIPAPYSIFENTSKVLPGTYIEIDLATQQFNEVVYWDVLDSYNKPKFDISEKEAMNETEKILTSACNYRMVSDVPVGVFLSGGYDSSCVAALLQKDRTEKIKTFTIGFNEAKYNEAEYAKKVASFLGTNHTEYYCSENDAKGIIPELPFIFDEPFGDSSAIPTILVSRIARKEVTVALSADAGDETFAGYSRYSNLYKNFNTLSKIPYVFRNPLGKLMGQIKSDLLLKKINKFRAVHVYDLIAEILKTGVNGPNISKYSSQRIPSATLSKLLRKKATTLHTFFDDEKLLNSSNDEITKILALDYKTYMVDDILTKVDRATMSVSLEGREPLLDFRLIEYAAQLPINFKMKGSTKKYLLKEIVHKYIPKEIMERPKMGFGVPLVTWFKADLKFYFDNYLNTNRLEKQGIFDSNFINAMVAGYYKGKNDDFELIWFLFIFQLWYDEWMN